MSHEFSVLCFHVASDFCLVICVLIIKDLYTPLQVASYGWVPGLPKNKPWATVQELWGIF